MPPELRHRSSSRGHTHVDSHTDGFHDLFACHAKTRGRFQVISETTIATGRNADRKREQNQVRAN